VHPAQLHQAKFLLSAAELNQLPPDRGFEVAIAGRSNTGKSSAINAICARRRLAFVSRTPGRTQTINFYDLGEERRLADLPGYGYAAVPAAVRRHWEVLLGSYLASRRSLRALILATDARQPLTPLDKRVLAWFAATPRPVHVLMTKADKLSRQSGERQLLQTEKTLASLYPTARVQLFSSASGLGVARAREAVLALLAGS